MHVIVLAATHERALNSNGKEVPKPLLDLENASPYLTTMVNRLSGLPGLEKICVVTNEAIRSPLEDWLADLESGPVPVELRSDGTAQPEEQLGAIGDLVFALRAWAIKDDVLIIGGDNWFTYDIAEFLHAAREGSPALVVSAMTPGADSGRFGTVAIDKENRLAEFAEKSQSSDHSLKASCVYYFSAADIEWFGEFAKSHSMVCSPGTFIQWLVERTAVYGVTMKAAWYDIGAPEASALKGQDFLAFRDIVRRSGLRSATWEGATARELQWASSHLDLLDVLADANPNRRIVAATFLARAGEILTEASRETVVQALCGLLKDPRMNEISVDGSMDDENTAIFVSASAAEALARLGYAEDAEAVFEKAQKNGIEVAVKRNIGC